MKVSLQQNRAEVIPAVGQTIDLGAIPIAVRNAGFTPGEMRLTAVGTFSGAPPSARFRIRGWPSDLAVRALGALPGGEQRIFAPLEYADSLVLVVASGEEVR